MSWWWSFVRNYLTGHTDRSHRQTGLYMTCKVVIHDHDFYFYFYLMVMVIGLVVVTHDLCMRPLDRSHTDHDLTSLLG